MDVMMSGGGVRGGGVKARESEQEREESKKDKVIRGNSSSEEDVPRRERSESESSEEYVRRRDSESEEEGDSDASVQRRPPNEEGSSSDASIQRRPTRSSSSSSSSSSEDNIGLHQVVTKLSAKEMPRSQKEAMQMGKNQATVRRDKHGVRKQATLESEAVSKAKEAALLREWNLGAVDKQKQEAMAKRLVESRSFTTSIDDAELEAQKKAELRAEDPMMAYIQKQQAPGLAAKEKARLDQGKDSFGRSVKPKYVGPVLPNRFSVLPGYRWDGVDRSNTYEARRLKRIARDRK